MQSELMYSVEPHEVQCAFQHVCSAACLYENITSGVLSVHILSVSSGFSPIKNQPRGTNFVGGVLYGNGVWVATLRGGPYHPLTMHKHLSPGLYFNMPYSGSED